MRQAPCRRRCSSPARTSAKPMPRRRCSRSTASRYMFPRQPSHAAISAPTSVPPASATSRLPGVSLSSRGHHRSGRGWLRGCCAHPATGRGSPESRRAERRVRCAPARSSGHSSRRAWLNSALPTSDDRVAVPTPAADNEARQARSARHVSPARGRWRASARCRRACGARLRTRRPAVRRRRPGRA